MLNLLEVTDVNLIKSTHSHSYSSAHFNFIISLPSLTLDAIPASTENLARHFVN